MDNILRQSIYQRTSFATLAEAIENDNEQSQLFYERPGLIKNSNLLDSELGGYFNHVKKTLVEHFDFEVVPHRIWQHLYSWYSADVTICRKLVIDNIGNKSGGSQQQAVYSPFHLSNTVHSLAVSPRESRSSRKFRVCLELWPSTQNTYLTTTREACAQIGLDEADETEPASFDTTALLYKQNIEDYSSTVNADSRYLVTPEVIEDRSRLGRNTEQKKPPQPSPSNENLSKLYMMFSGAPQPSSRIKLQQAALVSGFSRNSFGHKGVASSMQSGMTNN